MTDLGSAAHEREQHDDVFTAACDVGHVRSATTADALDGVVPRWVASPADTQQAAAVMRAAVREDSSVLVRGSASKLRWGNPPERLDVVLDTGRMARVLEHADGDLVVGVQAGTTLATVQEVVARAGQRLALDPSPGTLGGIVAANASGPLRHRYGTVRDLLIGSTAVLADGTVARSGGKVVKNVAGYDLGKLFTGSFGTLGVLTELTFRLHPLPSARRVVNATVALATVGEACALLTASQLVASSLELLWDCEQGCGVLEVVFEGTEASVDGQADMAAALLRPLAGTVTTAEPIGTPSGPGAGGDEVIVKISALPSMLAGVLAAVGQTAGAFGLRPAVRAHAGVGVTTVQLAAETEAEQVLSFVHGLRSTLMLRHGAVVLVQSPRSLPSVPDRWGAVGALEVMRRVKEQFDPMRRLAPGRFVGGI